MRRQQVIGIGRMGRPAVLVVTAAIMLPATVQAGITLDSANSGSVTGTTLNFNHTLGGGVERLVVLCIQVESTTGNADLTATPTYGGVAMTKAIDRIGGTTYDMNVEIWYLLEADLPAPGVHQVSITAAAAEDIIAGAISVTGAAQQAPEATNSSDDGQSGAGSITTPITTLTDGAWIFDDVGSGNAITGFTATGGQTEQYDTVAASSRGAGGTEWVPTAGLQNQSWTADSASNRLVHCVAAFAPTQTNYRSIGTDSGVLHSAGNASITAGTGVVTFAGGANLPSNVGPGDELIIGGDTFYILSRDSATQATVQTDAATTHSSAGYTIRRAYNTLQAWEDARDGDLAGESRREIGVCYADGDFTAGVTINGSTTDSEFYMMLTAAANQRHTGKAGTGVRIDAGGGLGDHVIRLQDDYSVLEWIEITDFQDSEAAVFAWDGREVLIQNMIIHNFDALAGAIEMYHGGTIRNSIFYDGDTAIFLNMSAEGQTGTVENCTIYDATVNGIKSWTGAFAVRIRNTIVFGANFSDIVLQNDTISYFGYNMYETWNGFDPSLYQGRNQLPPADLTDLFRSVTPGSEDLRLHYEDNLALRNGVDLSGDFTTDIEGATRAVPWDIGADECYLDVSYRSIGTNSATLHSAGTASITAGDRLVTFSGVLPTTVIGQGDEIVIGGETLYLDTIVSTTEATVQSVAAATHTNAAFTISRAYNTLQAWEDDRGTGNFITLAKREVGVAYNDGPFAAGLDWNFVGVGQYTMKLTVAPGHRHDGTAGSGVVLDATSIGATPINITSSGPILEWFEITNIGTGLDGIDTPTGVAGGYLFSNLLIHDDDANRGIRIRTPGTIRNCIIYGGMDRGIRVAVSGNTVTIESCTVHGCGIHGIRTNSGTNVTVRNVISVANATDFSFVGNVTYFGYNMYEDGFDVNAYDGNNQPAPADLDDLFVDPASDDFHLESSGHNALDTGLDLSSDFTIDIDGEVRSGAWDLGADWSPMGIFYFSIGTNAATLYDAGNASVAAADKVVTFGGAANLPTNIGQGDELVIGAETLYVMSRDSATQVTLQLPASTVHTSEAYTISRVYNTLQAWEDDRGGDLAGEGRQEVGVCYNDGPFTSPLVISGSTTDATHSLTMTVAAGQRHDGITNSGARIDALGGWSTDAITVEDEYTRIEWLEITGVQDYYSAIFFDDNPPADNGAVHGVFVHDFWQGLQNAAVKVYADGITIRNCFITGGTHSAIEIDNGGSATVENCTLWGYSGGGHGLYVPDGDVAVSNTISVDHGTLDMYIETAGTATISYFGYNMFSTWGGGFDPDDIAYAGNNQWPPKNLEHLFEDLTTIDLHLESRGHYAGNNGIDLSTSFTDDIDGATRVDAWDIGADEGIPGTEELDPKVLTWREVEPN